MRSRGCAEERILLQRERHLGLSGRNHSTEVDLREVFRDPTFEQVVGVLVEERVFGDDC